VVTYSKKDIRLYSSAEIKELFIQNGGQAFRAKQLFEWLWKKHVLSFDNMTNLPAETKAFLNAGYEIKPLKLHSVLTARDNTSKLLFRLYDGKFIEGVLIPSANRATACISSQVGCPLACKFCATGKIGFTRNLEYPEIFDQFMALNKFSLQLLGTKVSNIVFMGMGEPLLNYEQVLKAIELITAPELLNFAPDRITLSTVGIVKMIKKMADDKVRFNLALSLHAATDKKRNTIIPVNIHHPLNNLAEALQYFCAKTKSRITIEYILFDKFNDTPEDAVSLLKFCKNFPCKINLIEYNPVKDTGFRNTHGPTVKAFADFLRSKNLVVNIRKSKGKDIAAACGQLAGTFKS